MNPAVANIVLEKVKGLSADTDRVWALLEGMLAEARAFREENFGTNTAHPVILGLVPRTHRATSDDVGG